MTSVERPICLFSTFFDACIGNLDHPISSSFLVVRPFPSALACLILASMATSNSGDSVLPNEVRDIINCVAIYYEKCASGNAFLQKEKF